MCSAANIFYLAVFALLGPARAASRYGSADTCAVSDMRLALLYVY